MRVLPGAVCAALLLACRSGPGVYDPSGPAWIILDTDMDSDCDDVGALAVLHALADLGEAKILATMVSSKNEGSAACVDAINTFYGRPDLPIGVPKGAAPSKPSKYAKEIASRFPHDLGSADWAPDAAELYREILLRQPDHSVVIATVGYLTNIAALLRLPAEGSLPSGRDVVARKVRLWACMGGNFVGSPAKDDLRLGNNNFTYDKESAYYAVWNWPGTVMFVGREIGSVPSGLKAGSRLRELPGTNPIRAGYELYFGGEAKDRHVADQTTVLFAVRGLRDYWDAQIRGFMVLRPELTFHWNYDGERKQGYLVKRMDDRRLERIIEDLMLRPPAP